VVDAASRLDPLVPADTVELADRTLVIPVPKKQGLAVVQLKTYWPITLEAFRQQEPGLANSVQLAEARDAKDNPFSLSRLRERLHVKMAGKNDVGDKAQPPDIGD
jgi:hypothetical protein